MKKRKSLLLTTVFLVVFLLGSMTVYATQSRSSAFNTGYTRIGNGAKDIVSVALAQSGRTGASFGYSEEWCADFVGDCALLAGQSQAIPANGWVYSLHNNILYAGGQHVAGVPQPGDIAIYDWGCAGGYNHVEIVYAVDGTTVYTVGGNSGGGSSLYYRYVNKHAYHYASSCFTCFVRPRYYNTNKQEISVSKSKYKVGLTSSPFTVEAHITKGNGTLRYRSSNNSVIRVNQNGKVKIVGAGVAYVIITASETASYSETSVSVKVTVRPDGTKIKRNQFVLKKGKLHIFWCRNPKVDGYQIQYSSHKDMRKASVININGNRKKHASVPYSKKVVYARIRTRVGNAYSKWSAIKTMNFITGKYK